MTLESERKKVHEKKGSKPGRVDTLGEKAEVGRFENVESEKAGEERVESV